MSNRVSAKLEERRLMVKEKKFDLQDRLIDYAVRIMKMSEKLPIPCMRLTLNIYSNYFKTLGLVFQNDH